MAIQLQLQRRNFGLLPFDSTPADQFHLLQPGDAQSSSDLLLLQQYLSQSDLQTLSFLPEMSTDQIDQFIRLQVFTSISLCEFVTFLIFCCCWVFRFLYCNRVKDLEYFYNTNLINKSECYWTRSKPERAFCFSRRMKRSLVRIWEESISNNYWGDYKWRIKNGRKPYKRIKQW